MTDNTATRKHYDVEAPELGAHVQLFEASVGEMLPIITASEKGTSATALMLETLAVCMRIDGKRLSVAQIHALPASSMRALSKLGPQALAINGFGSVEVAEGGEVTGETDAEKK